jgi:hypothetical protein
VVVVVVIVEKAIGCEVNLPLYIEKAIGCGVNFLYIEKAIGCGVNFLFLSLSLSLSHTHRRRIVSGNMYSTSIAFPLVYT